MENIKSYNTFVNEAKIIKDFTYTASMNKEVTVRAYDFGQLILAPSKISSNVYGNVVRKMDNMIVYKWNTPVKSIKFMKGAVQELNDMTDWDVITPENSKKLLYDKIGVFSRKYGGITW